MSVYIKVCPDCRSGMDWDDDENAWVCHFCGNRIETDEDDWDVEEDEDEKPAGCIACGNTAFPQCKISCNMFDD